VKKVLKSLSPKTTDWREGDYDGERMERLSQQIYDALEGVDEIQCFEDSITYLLNYYLKSDSPIFSKTSNIFTKLVEQFGYDSSPDDDILYLLDFYEKHKVSSDKSRSFVTTGNLEMKQDESAFFFSFGFLIGIICMAMIWGGWLMYVPGGC